MALFFKEYIIKYIWQYTQVFLISMVPLIELRGAIPYGINILHLRTSVTFVFAILGNCIIVPFLVFFLKRILVLCTRIPKLGPYFQKVIDRAVEKSKNIGTAELWGLFIFVAIPLPGTGCWTGSLIATILQLPAKKSIPVICAGVITAGIIMAVASRGLLGVFSHLLSW